MESNDKVDRNNNNNLYCIYLTQKSLEKLLTCRRLLCLQFFSVCTMCVCF